jgi:hypothetical protein
MNFFESYVVSIFSFAAFLFIIGSSSITKTDPIKAVLCCTLHNPILLYVLSCPSLAMFARLSSLAA